MKRLSMAKISILVSVTLFSILLVTIIIILNFNRSNTGTDKVDDRMRIGLILNGRIDDHSWGQSHYDSLMRISDEVQLDIIYRENTPEDEGCEAVVRELVETEKCTVVIANSFGFGEYMTAAAEKYPDVYFFHASGSESGRNLSSYFGRMYQFRYLSGIIAGVQTATGRIGYVAAFPIDEVNRGINAFTLGVRSVRPDAEVYVSFCDSWTDEETARASTEKLINEYSVDVVTMHTDSLSPLETADKNGVWSIGYNCDNSDMFPDTYLTACVWEWDSYYREQIQACRQGKFHGEHTWLGYESGIMKLVDPAKTGNAVPGYEAPLKAAEDRFADCTFDVFYGPVTDNNGVLRIPEGESMSDRSMLEDFGWYAEGVRIV